MQNKECMLTCSDICLDTSFHLNYYYFWNNESHRLYKKVLWFEVAIFLRHQDKIVEFKYTQIF